jgi:hypothetical protein
MPRIPHGQTGRPFQNECLNSREARTHRLNRIIAHKFTVLNAPDSTARSTCFGQTPQMATARASRKLSHRAVADRWLT